jgi:radical SAM-linked protein
MRLRITFAKLNALRYTGHLDLHHIWERAARRAELPLAYSQGFHPQPRISLASALPLGFSSRCEGMDMRLSEEIPLEGLRERIQAAVPSGLQILQVESVDEKLPALQTLVAEAEYEVLFADAVERSALTQRVAQMMDTPNLPRERRGKSYDLRPLIEQVSLITDPKGITRLRMRLAAREGATGRPEEVLDHLGIPADTVRVERTRLIFANETIE